MAAKLPQFGQNLKYMSVASLGFPAVPKVLPNPILKFKVNCFLSLRKVRLYHMFNLLCQLNDGLSIV